MSLEYRISKKANQDLDDIWFHTYKKWSITQADR
jgi:plasmid stabilization system protein ParE